MAKELATTLNAIIAQQLGRQAASKTIEQKVAAMMPVVLEQAFILDFLQHDQASARRRRAILSHLLSAAELQSMVGASHRLGGLVMLLRAAEVLNVHWTKEIEAEWSRSVVAKQDAEAKAIQACIRGMRDAVDGWEVNGYAKHEAKFEAVDAKDRHVAAAVYKLSSLVIH